MPMDLLKNKRTIPFWLFTFFVIVILIISQLVQDGMFMDGLLYTVVGKNLADGLGSFWDPHVSKTIMYSFHEQPPLYFGLLALFYKTFGNSMYVERLFCFVFFSGTAIYIHRIWKKIYSFNSDIAEISWLPILFWITIPLCFWAYTNHVEETVMAFFALAAVYHIYIALDLDEYVIWNLIVAGIFIFLSSLTKGAQGLFPIIGAAAYWLVSKKVSFQKMITYSLILIAIPTVIYILLLITDPKVYNSYHIYFNIRYIRAFNGAESTTDNRFEIIGRLFMELLPIILFSMLILFFMRKHKQVDEEGQMRYGIILWMFLIGLSGTLPLMVTFAQRGFYLVTALPYFAIGIAMLLAPRLASLINKITITSKLFRIFMVMSAGLLIASIIFTGSRIGKCKRDGDVISDVYEIGTVIPHGDIATIPSEMLGEWSIRYYLLRYFYISIDSKNENYHYFIIWKKSSINLIPKGYKLYPLNTKELDLYVLKQAKNEK